jgi:hypothetical protein
MHCSCMRAVHHARWSSIGGCTGGCNKILLPEGGGGSKGEERRHWAQGSGPNGMRAGSPSGVPSAPGAGPSIRSGMPSN